MEKMEIHDLVKSLLFLGLTSVLAHGERPNIIRVICDDLTSQAMGCYGSAPVVDSARWIGFHSRIHPRPFRQELVHKGGNSAVDSSYGDLINEWQRAGFSCGR